MDFELAPDPSSGKDAWPRSEGLRSRGTVLALMGLQALPSVLVLGILFGMGGWAKTVGDGLSKMRGGSQPVRMSNKDCRRYDGNVKACDTTPGCAYYYCSGQCWLRGTTDSAACGGVQPRAR